MHRKSMLQVKRPYGAQKGNVHMPVRIGAQEQRPYASASVHMPVRQTDVPENWFWKNYRKPCFSQGPEIVDSCMDGGHF